MLTAPEVLSTYFLETRCQLLEIGAVLDRLDRAAAGDPPSDMAADERLGKVYQSLQLLADRTTTPDRAERLLHLFSDPA